MQRLCFLSMDEAESLAGKSGCRPEERVDNDYRNGSMSIKRWQ
jgi:hypothetical protein